MDHHRERDDGDKKSESVSVPIAVRVAVASLKGDPATTCTNAGGTTTTTSHYTETQLKKDPKLRRVVQGELGGRIRESRAAADPVSSRLNHGSCCDVPAIENANSVAVVADEEMQQASSTLESSEAYDGVEDKEDRDERERRQSGVDVGPPVTNPSMPLSGRRVPSTSLVEAVPVNDVSRFEAMVHEAIASRVESSDAAGRGATAGTDFDDPEDDDKNAATLPPGVAVGIPVGDSSRFILHGNSGQSNEGDGDRASTAAAGKGSRYRRYGIAIVVTVVLVVAVVVGMTAGLGARGGGGGHGPMALTHAGINVADPDDAEEIPYSAFASKEDLQAAIDAYLVDKSNTSAVSVRYGHPIGTWDVSHVTDFKSLFFGKKSFNENLTGWNVSQVTTMANMFDGCTSFNSDISMWDTSSCSNMATMFQMARQFRGNLSAWDVSKVTDMQYMFNLASSFSSDISAWDVGNVISMANMFNQNVAFFSDLSKWDVKSVQDMSNMFKETNRFDSDLSNWNTVSLTSIASMFQLALNFSGSGVEKWDVSKCRNMEQAFNGAGRFRGGGGKGGRRRGEDGLSGWDVSKVTSMRAMFQLSSSFNGNISNWNVQSVTDMTNMFNGAKAFNQNLCPWIDLLPLSVDVSNMFSNSGCPIQDDDTTLLLSGNETTAFCYSCGGGK